MAKQETKIQKELSVEERLNSLYELQKTLSNIDEIRTLRGELPLEVSDLEDEVAGLKTRLEKIKEEISELGNVITTKKQEIVDHKANIEKYKEQQNSVRNNREYDFLTKEIEFKNLEVELGEKKMREAQEQKKQREEDVEKTNTLLDEKEKDLVVKKKELETIVAETKSEEEVLREKAKTIEVNIEERLLQSFKRIRKNARNGLGIVYVQRDACGGCFNKIPPQRQLDIRSRKKIIVCEYCGRILIDPELAGVHIEVKEEKPVKKRGIRRRSAEE